MTLYKTTCWEVLNYKEKLDMINHELSYGRIVFIIHPCNAKLIVCYLIWPCDMAVHTLCHTALL